MKSYLIELEYPEAVSHLQHLEKVGKPQALKNFVIVKTTVPVHKLREIPGVKSVEPDGKATMSYVQSDIRGWALPWISNTGGTYEHDRTGQGVDIYVMDTGVRDTHVELQGRVSTLWSFDDLPYNNADEDSPWHGTAVAACAAGSISGTAKRAQIINVRIDFYNSTILKALDVVLKDHLEKHYSRPSVLNFSGASILTSIGNAFAVLPQYGIVVVAASGNDAASEPAMPARNPWIVSVGALNEQEGPAYFTNRKCQIYAPGQNISTASSESDHAARYTSGTSFAAPYYAGLLACQLQGSDRFNTGRLASTFSHFSQMRHTDSERIPVFDNSGYPVRTCTTRYDAGTYYQAPSRLYTNHEINDFCRMYEAQPQIIADAALDMNVGLDRFVAATGYSAEDINGYFLAHGVSPWWFVNNAPVGA